MNAEELRETLTTGFPFAKGEVRSFYYDTDLTIHTMLPELSDEELMEKFAKWQIERSEV